MNRFGVAAGAMSLLMIGVVLFAYGMRSGLVYLQAAPVLIVLGILAVSKPVWLLLGGIATLHSKLVLPGFPGQLEMYHLFFLAASAVVMVRVTLTKERLVSDPVLRWLGLGYGIVTFYTMMARGLGFRLLGDDQIGGMRYVLVYIAILCLWFLPNLQLKPTQLRRAFVVMVLLSGLPLMAEVVLLASGGAIHVQYYFLEMGFGLDDTFMASMQGSGFRITSALYLGLGLTMFPFLVLPLERSNRKWYILLLGAGFVCLALAGFRLSLFKQGAVVFSTLWLVLPGKRKELVTAVSLIGVVLYGGIFLFFDLLPFGVQRSLSFLPFIGEGTDAAQHAFSSTNFRFGVWDLVVQQIPDYLLLGRGMTYDMYDAQALYVGIPLEGRHYEYGMITNPHNGPLATLLFLGIPGAACMAGLLVRFSMLISARIRRSFRFPQFRADITFFSVFLGFDILFWVLSFGNPHKSLLEFVIYYVFLKQIRKFKDSEIGESGPDNATQESFA